MSANRFVMALTFDKQEGKFSQPSPICFKARSHRFGFHSGQLHFRREIGNFLSLCQTQSTVENADRSGECESAFRQLQIKSTFCLSGFDEEMVCNIGPHGFDCGRQRCFKLIRIVISGDQKTVQHFFIQHSGPCPLICTQTLRRGFEFTCSQNSDNFLT